MALIENLERDDWQEFLRMTFDYTLEVLKDDQFRSVSSSVDDLSAWLALGGVSRARLQLARQMDGRRFPPDKQAAVLEFVDQLAREYHPRLLALSAEGIIGTLQQK